MPQCSILGPLPFLISRNDIDNELLSNAKLFANYTLLFLLSVGHNIDSSAAAYDNDLAKISKWEHK